MTTVTELQTAFFEMFNLVASREGWIITVYQDNDPRVHGATWEQNDDIIFMSDDLYSLYCANVGMENVNYRAEQGI